MTATFRPFEPSAETELTSDLATLVEKWEEVGVDPDDFCRCAACHRFFAWAALPEDIAGGNVCSCPDEPTR